MISTYMSHCLLRAARVLLVPLLHVLFAIDLIRAGLALGLLSRVGFICGRSYKDKDVSNNAGKEGTTAGQEARLAERVQPGGDGRSHRARTSIGLDVHIRTRSRRRIQVDRRGHDEGEEETKRRKNPHLS